MPNRSSHRRTTRIGPPTARSVQTTATRASQKWDASRPNRRLEATLATCPMAQNSTAVHPTSWSRLRADGRNEPRSPRTGRNSHMDGTPSRSPARPTSASGRHPMADPTTIARSAFGNPSAGTRSAPVTITSNPTERSPHRTARSPPDRRRRSGGTGRIPQDGASRSRTRSRRSVRLDMVRLESTREPRLRPEAEHPLEVRERAAHQPAHERPVREQGELTEHRHRKMELLGPREPGATSHRLEDPLPHASDQAPVRHHQPAGWVPHRDLQVVGEQWHTQHSRAHRDDHADALAMRREHPYGVGVLHPCDLLLPREDAAPRLLGRNGETDLGGDPHGNEATPAGVTARAPPRSSEGHGASRGSRAAAPGRPRRGRRRGRRPARTPTGPPRIRRRADRARTPGPPRTGTRPRRFAVWPRW